ncbi:hypothetical protein AFLA_004904 [Aspergillus flavus NRRL3357]|nr:hypothetical protein AFLA_004904 [Aspergillus flavus NRRL3357]
MSWQAICLNPCFLCCHPSTAKLQSYQTGSPNKQLVIGRDRVRTFETEGALYKEIWVYLSFRTEFSSSILEGRVLLSFKYSRNATDIPILKFYPHSQRYILP